MVAPNKSRRVVCTVVRVAERPMPEAVRFERRPSDLVPWADPYIAGLVRRLQSEVRMERARQRPRPAAELAFDNRGASQWLDDSLHGELDPPSPADGDWEWSDRPRWTTDGEPEALL
ncbi:MAG: hypothetical protein DCC67_17990 [Planctomycetota bacterium]|nr:MAG: hypothetical protein DCC67_17990 [Planctomycetota bacterium]